MAELLFLKGYRFTLDFLCFLAAALALFENIAKVKIKEWLGLNEFQNGTVVMLSIIFLCVRIVWFLYEKLHIDRRERKNRAAREIDEFNKMLKEKLRDFEKKD